ncbi:hypothetical protein BH09PAT3_BH09PAT3_3000 [soil metagenome]
MVHRFENKIYYNPAEEALFTLPSCETLAQAVTTVRMARIEADDVRDRLSVMHNEEDRLAAVRSLTFCNNFVDTLSGLIYDQPVEA